MRIIDYILIVITWLIFLSAGFVIAWDMRGNRIVPADPLAMCKECIDCPIDIDAMLETCDEAFAKVLLYEQLEELKSDVAEKVIKLKLKDL